MKCNMLTIGERINTVREQVLRAYQQKDSDYIRQQAVRQAEAGANIIDVNAGTTIDSEPSNMAWAVQIIQDAVDVPLCIDSPNPQTLRAGLEVCRDKKNTWVNSMTLEKTRMEGILPLVKEYGCPLVALCMVENGVPETAAARVELAKKLTDIVDGYGIPLEHLYLDVLIEPVGVRADRGLLCLETIRAIKSALPQAKTVICLSAVSFGLPERRLINRTYLPLLMYEGIDAVILDVLDSRLMAGMRAAHTLLDKDDGCLDYIRAYRQGKLEQTP